MTIITGIIAAWYEEIINNKRIPKIKIEKSKMVKNLNLPMFVSKFWEKIVIDWPIVEINIKKIANSEYSYSDNFK